MGSGTTKYLGVALAAGAVSAVVSSLIVLTLGSDSGAPPPAAPPSTIDLTAIQTEIRSLRQELERITDRLASWSAPSATTTAEGRSPVEAEPIDLTALHDAIAKLEEIANQAPSAQRSQMLAEMHTLPRLPENWIALDQLVSLGDAADREVVNLTFQEIHQRFGTPTGIDASEDPYVRWKYWKLDRTGNRVSVMVTLSFLEGRVATLNAVERSGR